MLTEWKKIQLIEIMKEYIIQKKRRVDKTKLLFYSLSVEVREAKQQKNKSWWWVFEPKCRVVFFTIILPMSKLTQAPLPFFLEYSQLSAGYVPFGLVMQGQKRCACVRSAHRDKPPSVTLIIIGFFFLLLLSCRVVGFLWCVYVSAITTNQRVSLYQLYLFILAPHKTRIDRGSND